MTCPHSYNARGTDAANLGADHCSICLRAEVAELRLQLEASREHTAEVIASGEALAAERDSAHAAVVEEQRLCALKLRGLTLERDFQAAQARDLGRQFREASDNLAAAESRAEKLERALELSILCNDLHARIWDTPEVRAKAAAMFDEYGVSNWPDMHAVVIRKARSALSASGGEGK